MQTNQTEAQQMAAALLAYLNQLEILPVNIALERAEERPAAVMTLREEPAYRRYDLAGGYKAQFPFAVSYCLTPDGQAQRIAAIEALCRLGEWLEAAEPAKEGLALGQGRCAVSFEWESFPAQTQAQEPEERYQTKFTLIDTQEEQ